VEESLRWNFEIWWGLLELLGLAHIEFLINLKSSFMHDGRWLFWSHIASEGGGKPDKRLSPNLRRGRGKSIGGDLNIDNKGSKQTSNPFSHYTKVSLVINLCTHKLTLLRRLIPANAIKNTSKNREVAIKIADEWLSTQSSGLTNHKDDETIYNRLI
jgi:hypothetical protein